MFAILSLLLVRGVTMLALLLLLLVPAQATLRVAFLTDLHVGENCSCPYDGSEDCPSVINDRRAIARINALSPLPDAVIITGDLTSSATASQWAKAADILSTLSVPYFPAMGNHDVWPYKICNHTETPGPSGDLLFEATFGAMLRASPLVTGYDPHPVRNLHNTSSAYQNWQLTLPGDNHTRLAFLAGDWSTREPAPPGDMGVPGWAERGLSDFPGGPLPWLRTRLAQEAALPPGERADALFLVQHQPITCPFYIPDALFCFGAGDKALLEAALLQHWPRQAWWGVFAGHNHLYLNQSTPFLDWPEFREVETSAAKGDGLDGDKASAFSLVSFEGAAVARIEQYEFSIAQGVWSVHVGK
jgi:predicted MPP superfamily phosphohydrolase